MNLMNIIRLCGVVVIGWTLLAMGVGALHDDRGRAAQETNFFLPQPALHEAVAVSPFKLDGMEEYRLVDRSSGHEKPMALPDQGSWSLVRISPWRDQDGNLEAVGRWSRRDSRGDEGFWGLGLFRLSDSTVVQSIDLDVLPTGRPCWVPGRPGDLVFPAGDGQLHRCRLSHNANLASDKPSRKRTAEPLAESPVPRPVTWRCAVPGSGSVYISDAVWPAEEQLRKFIFASLSTKSRVDGKLRAEPAQIWWLEMSPRGDEILSAGRLTALATSTDASAPTVERMPNVTVSPAGRLTLAYLARVGHETSWRLCCAAVSIEKSTGKPTIVGSPVTTNELPGALLPSPPAFSSDGQTVFASTEDGQIKKCSLARLSGEKSQRARD